MRSSGLHRAVKAAMWCACICWAVVTAAEAKPLVSDIRHGVHGDRVRVLIDITPAPAFAAFTLNNPDRLVLDFPTLDWGLPEGFSTGIPYVEALRYGLFRPDRARMVMDLTEPVAIQRVFTQSAQGTEPGRLILDIAPTSREEFDARAGAPESARWEGDVPNAPETQPGQIIVAIDPGHGGVDPGASHGRLKEKTIAMAFSRALAEAVDARRSMTAYLVRTEDVFVPLAERVARAHRANAHVFLSIHADKTEEGIAEGMSIYKLSAKGSDRAAERLAERENRADLLAGADLGGESDTLAKLVIELAQRGTADESGKLATSLLDALKSDIKMLRTRPVRQGNFRVLKAPDIPSLLLEVGFLNSARDRKRLVDPIWRAQAAERIAEGIADWMKIASPGFLAAR